MNWSHLVGEFRLARLEVCDRDREDEVAPVVHFCVCVQGLGFRVQGLGIVLSSTTDRPGVE